MVGCIGCVLYWPWHGGGWVHMLCLSLAVAQWWLCNMLSPLFAVMAGRMIFWPWSLLAVVCHEMRWHNDGWVRDMFWPLMAVVCHMAGDGTMMVGSVICSDPWWLWLATWQEMAQWWLGPWYVLTFDGCGLPHGRRWHSDGWVRDMFWPLMTVVCHVAGDGTMMVGPVICSDLWWLWFATWQEMAQWWLGPWYVLTFDGCGLPYGRRWHNYGWARDMFWPLMAVVCHMAGDGTMMIGPVICSDLWWLWFAIWNGTMMVRPVMCSDLWWLWFATWQEMAQWWLGPWYVLTFDGCGLPYGMAQWWLGPWYVLTLDGCGLPHGRRWHNDGWARDMFWPLMAVVCHMAGDGTMMVGCIRCDIYWLWFVT